MTRAECEIRIAEHMEAIIGIAKQYDPNCDYLSAAYVEQKGGATYFVTNGKENEAPVPIDIFKSIKRKWHTVNVEFDLISRSFRVLVDGKVEFEHLAQDEVSEVVRNLMP